jgi:hypothetical protein
MLREFAVTGLFVVSLVIAHALDDSTYDTWWKDWFFFVHTFAVGGAVVLFCAATVFRVAGRNFRAIKRDLTQFFSAGNTERKSLLLVVVAIAADVVYSCVVFALMFGTGLVAETLAFIPASARVIVVMMQAVSLMVFAIVSVKSLLRLGIYFFAGSEL